MSSLKGIQGKKILITGHTGFKGSWLCRLLFKLGAEVYGYSLSPPTDPNLYELLDSDSYVDSEIGDICDYDRLFGYYSDVSPDMVIHMAAQPLVREGYKNPRLTYHTNVMGTVNIMECARLCNTRSVLNVTTDKVYYNDESGRYYKEGDVLDGFDPYSNSKSCSELVTHTYIRSFPDQMTAVSTARAGNVIGGGDFADDRIIPDCVRSAIKGQQIRLRNPNSIRPYQHVLEPLFTYTSIICAQYYDKGYSGSYNIGPEKDDCVTTGALADMFCQYWGNGLKWYSDNDNGPHEANYLKLDNGLIKERFGIRPLWNISKSVEKVVEWTRGWVKGDDILSITDRQIEEYLKQRSIEV